MLKTSRFKLICAALFLVPAFFLQTSFVAAEGGDSPVIMSLSESPDFVALGVVFPGERISAARALAYPGLYGLSERQNFTLTHSALFEGTVYDSFGYVYPTLNKGTFGLGIYRINSGDAEGRDTSGALTGSFSDTQLMGKIGYGNQLLPYLAWGGGVSFINREMAGIKSGFLTTNMGVHYSQIRNTSIDLAVDNLSYSAFGDTEDTLPTGVRLNTVYELLSNKLAVAGQVAARRAVDFAFAVQYSFNDNLSFRLGRTGDMSGLGLGFDLRNYRLDYSMGMHALGIIHQLSLTAHFGETMEQKRSAYAAQVVKVVWEFIARGYYAKAFQAINNAARYKELSNELLRLQQSLEELADVEVLEITGNGPTQVLLRKGVTFYLAQKFERAKDMFLQVQAADREDRIVPRLMTLPGFIQAPGSKTSIGAPELPKFTEVDPIRLKLFKTEEYFNNQQWDLALKECREVLELNPREVTAYVRMGSILYAIGMTKEAVESWKYAERLNPNDPEVVKTMQFIRQMPKNKSKNKSK